MTTARPKQPGALPSEFGLLTNLHKMDLAFNRLEGKLPSQIGHLTNLGNCKETCPVKLDNNRISGELPSELGQLTNMVTFHMNNNSLDGTVPYEIQSWKNMMDLRLDTNNLDGCVPKCIDDCKNTISTQPCSISGNNLGITGRCVDDCPKIHCPEAPAGWYKAALFAPAGECELPCPAGYWCPPGTNYETKFKHPCDAFNCPEGSKDSAGDGTCAEGARDAQWNCEDYPFFTKRNGLLQRLDVGNSQDLFRTFWDDSCCNPHPLRPSGKEQCCTTANPYDSDFCAVAHAPSEKVKGPPLADICYINPKFSDGSVQTVTTQENDAPAVEAAENEANEEAILRPQMPYCDAIWSHSAYLAWPRSLPFVGGFSARPDALDNWLNNIDFEVLSDLHSLNKDCSEAMRAFVCTIFKPQCRVDRNAKDGELRSCQTCSDTCSAYRSSCNTTEIAKKIINSLYENKNVNEFGGATYQFQQYAKHMDETKDLADDARTDGMICHSHHGFSREFSEAKMEGHPVGTQLKALLDPDCADHSLFASETPCSSERPDTCGAAASLVPFPVASFDARVTERMGLKNAKLNRAPEIKTAEGVLKIPPHAHLAVEGEALSPSRTGWSKRSNQFTVVLDVRTLGNASLACQQGSPLRVSRLGWYKDEVLSSCLLGQTTSKSQFECTPVDGNDYGHLEDTPYGSFSSNDPSDAKAWNEGQHYNGCYFKMGEKASCAHKNEMNMGYAQGQQNLHGSHDDHCCLCMKKKGISTKPCALLGAIDGCPFDDALEKKLFCGNSNRLDFVVGRDVLRESYLNFAPSRSVKPKASKRTSWMRIVLSVDLHAKYARLYARRGPDISAKMYDERWLLIKDKYGEHWRWESAQNIRGRNEAKEERRVIRRDVLLEHFLNLDGPFSLPSPLLVASHGCATTEVAGITLYRAALHEREMKILAEETPKSGAISFMVDFAPHGVIKQTEGEKATVTIRMLHAPLDGNVKVRLILDSTDRIELGQTSVLFKRKEERSVTVHFKDDDIKNVLQKDLFTLRFESDPPTAWINEVDHLNLRIIDNDKPGMVLSTTTNPPFTKEEFFESYPDNSTGVEFTCTPDENKPSLKNETSLTALTLTQAQGSLSYSMKLSSEPTEDVEVSVGIASESSGPAVLAASPSKLTFTRSSWGKEQRITLKWDEDIEEQPTSSVIHHIKHFVVSAGSDYATANRAVLPLDVSAVPEPPGIQPAIIVVAVLVVLGVIVAIVAYFKKQKKKIQRVHSNALNRNETEKREMMEKHIEEREKRDERIMELQKNLKEAQRIVDETMQDVIGTIKDYSVKYEDIELGRKLGQGAFGTVYKGTYRGKDGSKEVAVKTVRQSKISEKVIKEFKDEIRIMAPLKHENLVGLIGGCWEDGPDKLCIVLEFCGRGSLTDLLTDSELVWNEPEHAPGRRGFHAIALDIAKCFKYLHLEQPKDPVVHRDLKPDNVLVTMEIKGKVADFGESKKFNADTSDEGETATIVGTPMFIAPEVLAGRHYHTPVDVYSFGMTLLQIIGGKEMFNGRQVLKQFMRVGRYAVIEGWRPKPSKPTKENRAGWALVKACWEHQPDLRPNFAEVVERLEAMDLDHVSSKGEESSPTVPSAEDLEQISKENEELKIEKLDAVQRLQQLLAELGKRDAEIAKLRTHGAAPDLEESELSHEEFIEDVTSLSNRLAATLEAKDTKLATMKES